ncbi:T9SS type A sorting domain-containing protein [candidate division WOR-3 bacterium]|nr:T9SS type A sorting domain-containing protein [candidate division WOR-3 bacterium]
MKIISLTFLIAMLATFAIGNEFPICAGIGNQGAPDVAFVGNEYIVVYDSLGDIWAARVDLQGNVLERFFIHTPDLPDWRDTLPAVATDGERWFVVWTARGVFAEEERFLGIWGAIYEGSTVIVEPFMIQTGATCFPAISCNGDIFLITGTVSTLTDPQRSYLRGRLYNRDGNPLFSDLLIDQAGGTYAGEDGYLGYPTISSDGDRFIVVYTWCRWWMFEEYTQHAIKYKFVTPDGSVEEGGVLFSENTPHYSVPQLIPIELIPKLYVIPPDIAFNNINYFCSYHVLENYLVLPVDGSYNVLGAVINQAGEILLNEIPIAVVEYNSEFASGVMAEHENFFVVWQDFRAGNFNIYGRHYSQDGNSILDEIVITEAAQDQTLPSVAFDDLNILVVWQDFRDSNWDIWGNLLHKGWTDDPLALAYNGNRHLVRKPNSQELHLIYTDHYYDGHRKVIYRYSSNGGNDWSIPEIIGQGKYPSITLSSDYLPSVTWTDENGGLWYRRKISSVQWSDIYHLWNPVGVNPLRLNSPPSIAIHASNPNTVHILVTRTGGPPRDVNHRVEDYTFTITVPMQGTFVLIEQAHGPHDPPLRTFPSIARCEVNNSLHAVWQRSDTICYATKPREQPWNNWGWQFFEYGLQSAHPFVETYGDSIFVVWQKKEGFYNYEEVYRAARHLGIIPPYFTWQNFSLTSETASLYPVNASGFFTVFVDLPSPHMNTWWEIYYKTRPQEPLYNISRAPYTWSHYPHSAARFCAISGSYLYTAWLEKPGAAYAIRFKRIHHMPRDMAYLTSSNGHNPSSPYLIARDSCISEWQIPVDIGYETITYQFPLVPGYRYKLKTVAYHEREDKWKTKVMIDNEEVAEIEYEAYEPETLECWIPSEFYADSIVEVIFECDDGDFASVGPIFIYQYEYEEGEGGFPGGPMTQENQPINKFSFMITPNPFIQNLNIKFQNQTEKGISVRVYDVSGRLVKSLYRGIVSGHSTLTWKGDDENGRTVSQGVYFLQVKNLTSGDTFCRKIIKVR